MGCLYSKSRILSREQSRKSQDLKFKEYSWDKKQKLNPKDYTIENVDGGEAGRVPGTVDGQQFIIQNCKDAAIFVLDHINTITIDDCNNCRIVLGAVKGSVYLRNCNDCVLLVSCGQFRTRDCRKVDTFLCCATQPIIESSAAMRFGCYQLFYPELEVQFHRASLSVFNNNWSNIHDFTPLEGESNWSLFPESVKVEDYMFLPSSQELSRINISFLPEKSIVPYTWGPHKAAHGDSCLIVFFSDGQQVERARSFIQSMSAENPQCLLLQSKEVKMLASDAQRVFNTSSYSSVVERGCVIGLQYNGPSGISACQKVAVSIATSTGSTGLVYVSSSAKAAGQQIENFFNYADMQMAG